MKLSLFSNVLLASMLVFAVGCGKDKKSSKGSDYVYNNPYVTGATNVGATALTNLQSYINGNETSTSLIGAVNVVKQRYSCTTKEFLGINFLPYEKCSYNQVSSYLYATPNVARLMNNPDLQKVLNPTNGYAMGNVVQYGSVFKVEHVLNTGSAIETIQYTIESNRHSVVNPTIVKDTVLKRIDTVVSPAY